MILLVCQWKNGETTHGRLVRRLLSLEKMARNNGIVVNNGRASEVALLLIDVVNHFNFPGGKQLLQNASVILPHLKELKKRARKAGIPIIYVNDHFGRWRSSF